jgi:hypothetical protein
LEDLSGKGDTRSGHSVREETYSSKEGDGFGLLEDSNGSCSFKWHFYGYFGCIWYGLDAAVNATLEF